MSKKTLHQMIEDEALEEDILECIKTTKDINKKDKNGNTPLHLAINESTYAGKEVVQALIAAGADVNAKNNEGKTPLMILAYDDMKEVWDYIPMLIKAGAHLEDTDSEGNTPLLIAARGYGHAMDVLIEAGADVNAKNKNGDTPLILLAEHNWSGYNKLIEAGADVNAKNNKGYTPLLHAISKSHNFRSEDLIKAGAKLPAYYPDGTPILIKLLENNLWDVALERIEAGDDVSDPRCVFHGVGNIDILKALIKAGANVNVQDEEGWTAIHWAVRYRYLNGGNWEIFQLLLDHGVDLNAKNKEGKTALMVSLSTISMNLALCERLIRAGATGLNDTYFDRYYDAISTCLGRAVCKATDSPNDEELNKLIKFLLNHGAVLVFGDRKPKNVLERYLEKNYDVDKKQIRKLFKEAHSHITQPAKPKISKDALLRLIENDAPIKKIEAAIAAGADVNARDRFGDTPLHLAMPTYKEINESAIRVLIAAGADVNAKDRIGWTPLHKAANKDNGSVVRALLEAGADVHAKSSRGQTPLYMAVRGESYDEDTIRALLDAGADVNARDEEDRSPLHKVRNDKVAKILLDAGADVHAKGNDGRTPLHWVKSDKVAKILLDAGADVNAKDYQGATPLHVATFNRDSGERIVRALLEAGADVNVKDEDGYTPLHKAAQECDDEGVVRALLEAGADVNARAKWNSTPLHDVRDENVMKLLLDAGAEVNVKEERYDDTPLHRAVKNKMKVSGVRALIKAGADMNARNDRNKTPLDLAETKTMINALEKAMEEAAAKKKE